LCSGYRFLIGKVLRFFSLKFRSLGGFWAESILRRARSHELVFFFTPILEESSLRSAAKPERRTPATMSLGKRRGEGESNWDSTGGYDSKRMMMSGAAGGVPGGYGMQGFSAAAMPYGMMPVKKVHVVCVCVPPLSHHVGAHPA